MTKITDSGHSVKVDFGNGTFLSFPYCSVMLIVEGKSESVTFRYIGDSSVHPLFTALLGDLTINNTLATRNNVIELWDELANAKCGSGTTTADVELDDETIGKIVEQVKDAVGEATCDTSSLECAIGNIDCALDTLNGEEIGGYYTPDTCNLINEIIGEDE